MKLSRRTIKLLAFFQRIYLRQVSAYGRSAPGTNLEQRAKVYVEQLSDPSNVKAYLALENMRWEYDILSENCHIPQVLRLQLRILHLAESHQAATEIAKSLLFEPPVAQLWNALLLQAKADGASEMRFEFQKDGEWQPSVEDGPRKDLSEAISIAERDMTRTEPEDSSRWIKVSSLVKGTWQETLTIPNGLEEEVKNFASLLGGGAYPYLLKLVTEPERLPHALEFRWRTESLLLVGLT